MILSVLGLYQVQAANEADPEMPQYGGTRTLRKSAGRKVGRKRRRRRASSVVDRVIVLID